MPKDSSKRFLGPPLEIFHLLDSSCMSKGDQKGLISQIEKEFKDSEVITKQKSKKLEFLISHSSLRVEHSVSGFKGKNTD